ncbi:MAG: hypothetical protein GY809_09745, partial [Planctomycetes bacterium]|nr:hypothetical protein [Planctomycetota bacterium]
GATATAPIYISTDGGNTWILNNIVPSGNGMTGDITVGLSRNNTLYAGILRGGSGLSMRILRSANYTGATAMTQLLSRSSDQPYARVYSPMGGPNRNDDHLYVGHNETPPSGTPSATFEQSLDVQTAAAPAGLTTVLLEQRTPVGQDGPPVRQAIHPDGTVYAVYIQRTATSGSVRTGNIVVVRDDNWGAGATPYRTLTDPSDSAAGRFVVTGVSWIWNTGNVMGQERLGDRAAIAVDPTDNQTVYVAWCDRPAGVTGNTCSTHVRRSTDGGANWSADLRTIAGALNPTLAVNIRGDVGFSFQQLVGTGATQTWQTHFQQSVNGGTTWNDFILSNALSSTPVQAGTPYIGDYMGLTAAGKDFYGVFSANNTPSNANFPQGVTYQRNANFATNTLLNAAGTTAVNVSIDPFFFHVRNQNEDDDFYVRDWTDSVTVNDTGIEPSTNPSFFSTSDVWNRRSNAPGGFDAADRPRSQDPRETASGTNYAFARVHRKNTGSGQTVSLHFLKSELGTGSNYQAAGPTADPTLTFGAADQQLTMTAGYPWELITTGSTHTCMAVEISTPGDPIVAPGLTGRAPGWPNPDLMVIYDNNKAQRNMGVYTGSGDSGTIRYYAVVHNAATRVRNLVLQFDPREVGRTKFLVIGDTETTKLEKSRVILSGMKPGENRWVSWIVPMQKNARDGERASITMTETLRGLPLNGFTLESVRAPLPIAARDDLLLLAGNLRRIGYLFKDRKTIEMGKKLAEYENERSVEGKVFVAECETYFSLYREWLEKSLELAKADPFKIRSGIEAVNKQLEDKDPAKVFPAISSLNHTVDAFLTYLDKQRGDVADVGQNMRILLRLLQEDRRVRDMDFVTKLVEQTAKFEREFGLRKANAKDYLEVVRQSLPNLEEINQKLQLGQSKTIETMERSGRDPQALQKAHREFLLGWIDSR